MKPQASQKDRCLKFICTTRFFFCIFVLLIVFILTVGLVSTSQMTYLTKISKGIIHSDIRYFLSTINRTTEVNGTILFKTFSSKEAMDKDHFSWLIRHGMASTTGSVNGTSDPPPQLRMDIFGNTIEEAEEHPRQNTCVSCFTHNFKYILENDNICKLYTSNQEIDLLVLILTIHKNQLQRDTIRETWLSVARGNNGSVRYAFLLGQTSDASLRSKVEEESRIYGDILKEDFVDSYVNLTYKTIMAMKWTAVKCPAAKHLLKIDDDMFANIPNIVNYVRRNEKTLLTAVAGSCTQKAKPIRSPKSKWFASKRSYPSGSYPGFCSGTGYVTSGTVARKIYEVSPNVPFFHLEDVYVSLCVRKLGMKLVGVKGFHPYRPKLDVCLFKSESLFTAHYMSPKMIKDMWSKHCPKRTQARAPKSP